MLVTASSGDCPYGGLIPERTPAPNWRHHPIYVFARTAANSKSLVGTPIAKAGLFRGLGHDLDRGLQGGPRL